MIHVCCKIHQQYIYFNDLISFLAASFCGNNCTLNIIASNYC